MKALVYHGTGRRSWDEVPIAEEPDPPRSVLDWPR
jgi:hypothetical protein